MCSDDDGCIDDSRQLRSFMLARFPNRGFLLLVKKSKTKEIYQLPGGRSEKNDFKETSINDIAFETAIRELREETGLDLRSEFLKENYCVKSLPPSHRKHYYFFLLILSDNNVCNNLKITLSEEHDSYAFVESLDLVASLIHKHSKGIPSAYIEENIAQIKAQVEKLDEHKSMSC